MQQTYYMNGSVHKYGTHLINVSKQASFWRYNSTKRQRFCLESDSVKVTEDWRNFRARMIRQQQKDEKNEAIKTCKENVELMTSQSPDLSKEDMWAHKLQNVEVGSLLIASEDAHLHLGDRVWQQVILVVAHNNRGTAGLVLNRPSTLTIGNQGRRILKSKGISVELCNVFPDHAIYMGGYEAQHVMQAIHNNPNIAGSQELISGVYIGDYETFPAVYTAALNGYNTQNVKFFAGFEMWSAEQLKSELADGFWICAACSNNVILKQCLGLPVPLWVEVQQLMGTSVPYPNE
eukprot:TRINITY_DN1707_c0_g1_i1.p2 TRINITY_DN1707_c0_g1~~TRINITY_DN1707_c0_g1_i1.p2  ORF type:complete len:322 (-),score=35.56 TRINITY_DN1707_c0_g1_i1:328-1200(-)